MSEDRGCVTVEDGEILKITYAYPPSCEQYIHCLDIIAEKYLTADKNAFPRRMWVFTAGVNWNTEELKKIAGHVKSLDLAPAKVALVSLTELGYGLSRAYEVYRQQDHLDIMTFRTEAEAEDWLLDGVKTGDAAPL